MELAKKILTDFKDFDQPLVIKDQGLTYNRYIYKNTIQLTMDYYQKNELGSELLSIKMVDKNIRNLVDAKDKLEEFSNQICSRITFLSEKFKIIEIDHKNQKVQMRSYPPFVKQNEKLFFEIIINAVEPSLYLCRKSADPAKHLITPASFILNDEVLERLLENLTTH